VVIEFLTFDVDPADREQWMAVEAATWSRFLQQQGGFLGKELWVEEGDPGKVHAMIRWADRRSWHSIPTDELAAVDAAMGTMFRDCTCRTFDVIRDF